MKVEQKAKEYLKAQCQKRKEEFVIRMPEVYIADIPQAFIDGYNEGMKQKFNMTRIQDYPLNEWHLTKNELPELQTAIDTGDEYNTLVLCFWYDTDSRGKKTKVYDLDRWYPENDIWESGKQRDEVEAWMYLPEPPEEI
jgi:hypothetical protein